MRPPVNRPRLIIGLIGIVLTVGGLAWAVTDLPAFGHYHHLYGQFTARGSVRQRAATNSVNVITFDYRGFDTLGEEFILFVAVVGVVVLLRKMRDESDQQGDEIERLQPQSSESLRWLGAAGAAPVAVIAAYVITHGQLTPGGGFQGGVILMAAFVLVFVGGEFALLVRLRRNHTGLEMADALGAAGFAILGFGGLIATGTFFKNFLPFGRPGALLSGGFLPLANLAVGIEVTGAMLMVLAELLDQRLLRRRP